MLAICSFASFLSPFYWFLDLLNHFRAHALLASIILGTAAYFIDKKLLVLSIVILLGNSTLFLMRLYETSGVQRIDTSSNSSRKQITIVSANVYAPNNNYKQALDVITQENPDIIVLTETDEHWIENVSSLENTYPYSLKHPRSDFFGMAIYSKIPFQPQMISVGDFDLPLAVLDFKDFRLIVAHPIPPISEDCMFENKSYLKAVAQNSTSDERPVILAGDLNSTLWGDALKPLMQANLKRINPLGIAYTWPTQFPLFAMQIDHFFAKNIKAANFKVLGNIGSDHYPIQATIDLSKTEGQ